MERLVYARVQPIVDLLLFHEQTGLRHGRSTLDQTTRILSQEIEGRFGEKKTCAVFLDLTSTDDIVLHSGLTCKTITIDPRQAHDEPNHKTYT